MFPRLHSHNTHQYSNRESQTLPLHYTFSLLQDMGILPQKWMHKIQGSTLHHSRFPRWHHHSTQQCSSPESHTFHLHGIFSPLQDTGILLQQSQRKRQRSSHHRSRSPRWCRHSRQRCSSLDNQKLHLRHIFPLLFQRMGILRQSAHKILGSSHHRSRFPRWRRRNIPQSSIPDNHTFHRRHTLPLLQGTGILLRQSLCKIQRSTHRCSRFLRWHHRSILRSSNPNNQTFHPRRTFPLRWGKGILLRQTLCKTQHSTHRRSRFPRCHNHNTLRCNNPGNQNLHLRRTFPLRRRRGSPHPRTWYRTVRRHPQYTFPPSTNRSLW
mmetsp:Transcript_24158/g.51752  ORF Transcript_24158/g.51752 Transcript_24158/m.51752 type:complete len:323 (-) Transcript_24158:1288-2256(-)